MGFIKNAIEEASRSTGCRIKQLNAEQAGTTRRCIEREYANVEGKIPLWERLKGDSSKYDQDGWKAIADFPFDERITIFFDKDDEKAMYWICCCRDVVRIISECPGFVFYLTDDAHSFLLCHNDHDYLIGAGMARSWIENR